MADDHLNYPVRGWETEIVRYYLHGGKAQVDTKNLPLVCLGELQEFDEQADSLKRVLVGGKGTGKSTALVRKAARLDTAGILLVPNYHPYILRLDALELEEGKQDRYQENCTHRYWVQVWKLALLCIFAIFPDPTRYKSIRNALGFGATGHDAESEFFSRIVEKISRAKERLDDVLSPTIALILERHYDAERCARYFQRIRHNLPVPGDHRHAIVIDGIDEALAQYRRPSVPYAQSPWEAAQTGIIDAIADIERLGGGASYRVYSAIREEAYRRYQEFGNRTQAQVASFCLRLTYDLPDYQEQIFALNVRLSADRELAMPDGNTPMEKFVGVEAYLHPYVVGAREDVLQWIKRHTFGAPRELVLHGQNLAKVPGPNRKDRREVSDVINDTGNIILTDYLSEMVPTWNRDIERVYPDIHHNVLSPDDVEELEQKWQVALGLRPIEYLYGAGLIGVPNDVGGNHACTQKFLKLSEMKGYTELRPAAYYLVHPCLYSTILKKLSAQAAGAFHSEQFLVGQGLSCPRSVDTPKLFFVLDTISEVLSVSILAESSSWHPTPEEIKAAIDPDFTVQQAGTKLKYILFSGICLAMFRQQSRNISVDNICEVIADLLEKGFCPEVSGKNETRQATESYFREQLMFEDGKRPTCVKELGSILERVGASFSTSSGVSRTGKYHIEGLKWTEIRVQQV